MALWWPLKRGRTRGSTVRAADTWLTIGWEWSLLKSLFEATVALTECFWREGLLKPCGEQLSHFDVIAERRLATGGSLFCSFQNRIVIPRNCFALLNLEPGWRLRSP